MMRHKITPSVMVAPLDTQLNEPTNENSIKVCKVKPTNKKTLLRNFGD